MDSASTYFVTTVSYNKAFLLQSDRMAGLFVDVLQHYRRAHQISVHEFVVMPNHVHVLITPSESIETTVKRIKGCFSTRAIREFRFRQKIWQPSFYERRVRDSALQRLSYLHSPKSGKGTVGFRSAGLEV